MHRSKTDKIRTIAERDEDEKLAGAIRTWTRLSLKRQLALAAEVVECRAHELRLAYPSVINVAHGFRTTGEGDRTIKREACVTLMVRRKWSSNRAGRGRAIPPYLYAYCRVRRDRGRRLCAVPTDVESGQRYRIRPQSATVIIRHPTLQSQTGLITGVVRRRNDPARYALSCHHVLAMSRVTAPEGSPASGATVSINEFNASSFAATDLGWIGKLVRPSAGVSFDAAIARVDPARAAEARRSLLDPMPQDVIKSEDELTYDAHIHLPAGPVEATWVQTWSDFDRISYFSRAPHPSQSRVVEWAVTGNVWPRGGDSGAPVTTLDNRTLLGMHIAGAINTNRVFMLLGNFLMEGSNYDRSGVLHLASL